MSSWTRQLICSSVFQALHTLTIHTYIYNVSWFAFLALIDKRKKQHQLPETLP